MTVNIVAGKQDMFGLTGVSLVNPVNCLGATGKGLAYRFAQQFPISTARYKTAAVKGGIKIGHVYIDDRCLSGEPTIIYFPTKHDWYDDSRVEYIESGLLALREKLLQNPIPQIAMPAIGCGLGGISWDMVSHLVELHLGNIDKVDIQLFPPGINPRTKENIKQKYVY
jgi:O-acetyl-ADP-ribose deacetylase (regulator of RNase III)